MGMSVRIVGLPHSGCSCGWSFFRSFHSWLLCQDDDQIEAHQLHSKEEEGYKAACSVTSSPTVVVACRWSICRAVSRGPSVCRGDRSWTTSHCVTETVLIAAAVHLKRKIWGELRLKQRGWSSSQMGSFRGLSWSHGVTVTVMVAMTILLHYHHVVQAQDIFVGFYDQTCPSAESIVTEVVKEATAKDPTVPAAMIRLLFHDCFVQEHNLIIQTKISLPPLCPNTTRSWCHVDASFALYTCVLSCEERRQSCSSVCKPLTVYIKASETLADVVLFDVNTVHSPENWIIKFIVLLSEGQCLPSIVTIQQAVLTHCQCKFHCFAALQLVVEIDWL